MFGKAKRFKRIIKITKKLCDPCKIKTLEVMRTKSAAGFKWCDACKEKVKKLEGMFDEKTSEKIIKRSGVKK